MKKMSAFLFAVILVVLCIFSASATDSEYRLWDDRPYEENETTKILDHVVYKLYKAANGEAYYEVHDWFDTVEAASTVEEINIASEIDGIKVTKIQTSYDPEKTTWRGNDYYYKNKNYSVKKVTIPDTITEIGGGFFCVLDAVEELIIPASVKSIADVNNPFEARYGFMEMENLKRVTFLGDIYYLGGFLYCSKLESVTLKGDVKIVDWCAFKDCVSLKEIDLPETVMMIDHLAFSNTGLTSVTIPQKAGFAGESTFEDCKNLTEVIFAGEKRSEFNIPYGTFRNCTALKKVTFPETIRELNFKWYAFNGCTSLEEIVFPKNCKTMTLGEESLIYCTGLKSVTLPESCDNLTVGKCAFRGCSSLEEVTLPKKADSVSIGYKAFRECKKFTTLNNTDNITKIYAGAFRGCTAFESITLSDKIKFIGKNAFYGCKNLEDVTIKTAKNTPKIYPNAFRYTAQDIQFTVLSSQTAKTLKTALVKSGLKNPQVCYK